MKGLKLDGKAVAQQLEQELVQRIAHIEERSGRTPILATILVGDNPASETYVRMKGNACKRVGMESEKVLLPKEATTEQLLEVIEGLNAKEDVHGILLQHPVPAQIDERAAFDGIAIRKDVDGVTSHGFGRMAMNEPAFGSATPAGIMRLLRHYDIPLEGMHAVVVGRSPILGKPMAMMLLNAHCTVTICHSRTKNLPEIVKTADLVVGAVGRPEFIRGSWIREGAVVVDAGYNPGPVGDIELGAVVEKSRAFTPVPGGVGPMTIATLLAQTVEAAENSLAGAMH